MLFQRHVWSFSLRTLLVMIALLSLPLGWLSFQWHTVQLRAAYLPRFTSAKSSIRQVFTAPEDDASVSWVRSLLGDQPIPTLLYDPRDDQGGYELRRARELFPEAHIWGWPTLGHPRPEYLPKGIEPLPEERAVGLY